MIAYIPARSGSKRVPGKNIRLLGGKPVIAHVVETVSALDFVTDIFVSTDGDAIQSVSETAGAKVLGKRAAVLANDHTTLVELLAQDVERHLVAAGEDLASADILIILPTAALVSTEVLREAYHEYAKSNKPLLVATHVMPDSPFRALLQRENGEWAPLHPDKLMARTQDRPEARIDTGLFYFMKFAKMRNHPAHWFTIPGGIATYNVPESMAIDVDTPRDWEKLELQYQRLKALG